MRSSNALSDEVSAAITREVETQGQGVFRLEPYRAEEGLLGVDIGAELDQPQQSTALCDLAFALARTHGLAVFDPQLGRTVHQGDRELIERQYHLGSAFSQAAPLAYDSATTGSSASLRLWLIIGTVCLGALVLARTLTCAL